MALALLFSVVLFCIVVGTPLAPVRIVAMFITLIGISISVLGCGEHHKVSMKLPANGVLFAIGAALTSLPLDR